MTEHPASTPPAPAAGQETRGVDFHQVARPRDLVLLDEVHLPGGQRLGGARARVYALLEETRSRRLAWRIGRHTGPPGAVPTHVLCEPWSGGMEGTKRLREVRSMLARLREQKLSDLRIGREAWVDPDGRVTSTWLYRLAGTSSPAVGRPPADQPAQPPTPPEEETEGGAAHHTPTAPPSAHPPPLEGRLVWLVRGHPGDLATEVLATMTMDATPGASPCWIAPSSGLVEALASGALDLAGANEAYRQHLLRCYRSGILTRELSAHRRVVIWTGPAPFDPFPVLARALEALGATVYHHEESP